MATTWNFTHYRRDTFHQKEFQLSSGKGYATLSAFPAVGDIDVVYVALDTMTSYNWSGTAYVLMTTPQYIDLTGCTFLCNFRRKPHMAAFITWTEASGITLTDPTNGKFAIDEQIIDLEGGIWYYDIQITFPAGNVETYIKGTCTITEDISYV